jgi:hypothetical protein
MCVYQLRLSMTACDVLYMTPLLEPRRNILRMWQLLPSAAIHHSQIADNSSAMLDELAPWRPTRQHTISKEYVTAYFDVEGVGKSEPEEDFDDRHLRYNM